MFTLRSLITIALSAAVSASLTVAAAQPNVRAKVRQTVTDAQASIEAAVDSIAAQTSANVDANLTAETSAAELLPPTVTIVTEGQAATSAGTHDSANTTMTTDNAAAASTIIVADANAQFSTAAGSIAIDTASQAAVDNQTQANAGAGANTETTADVSLEGSVEGQTDFGAQFVNGLKGHVGSLTGGLFTLNGAVETEAGAGE